jgi:hypothetical protein
LERRVEWKALDYRVIVVAKEGGVRDWSAYIGAVPGDCHDKEWEDVAAHGSKLPEKIARVLFPNFKGLMYRD